MPCMRSVMTFAILTFVLLVSMWVESPAPTALATPVPNPIPLEDRQISDQKQSVRNQHILLAARSLERLQQAQAEHKKIGKRVADSAAHFVGTPYVWGGTGPQGFDCSGFTQYILKQNGIEVPRNSYDQYHVGRVITRQELQPGDLVFFTTYAPGPSHLGIYVGEGKFIHALNQQKGVTTSKLDTDYYNARFVGARRVVGTSL
ncbi:C40 family peptidase [Tumebacillus sp. ITR2]|uniref:C40 family peptidase n=1 Tax=Tumebacillus amylolyticus TaxID=2801339 RepID=A0ABS1JBR0_9BACL|nr:C40 family peptidase [Tumebacillus amylolyticus]MBL0387712.1 C40 family peptidase [Tumebacillus amylolyticus]